MSDTPFARYARNKLEERRRIFLDVISTERLRALWDALPDDGGAVIGENGVAYDCDDLHAALCRRGDGAYCDI
jgi:hypothetical protein